MNHLLFVYGSLKRGFYNSRFLVKSKFLETTSTQESIFDMKSLGTFPAVYSGGKCRIQGELYEIGAEELKQLDKLEGNGHFYQRELVKLANGKVAWMYLCLIPILENEKNSECIQHLLSWEVPSEAITKP